ncbi:hypothetical protein ACFWUP_01695 [Nocardia sp. NPDC058658]|uniref:hypothetical protein n=1 Tax=Nocardia sp. NPDC058658 TaxID=3346580 RepID=UPI003662AEB3
MTQAQSVKSTVIATTVLGFGCGLAALGVLALWWLFGPNSVSCYYASYEPNGFDDAFGEMAMKMAPTWWLWVGLVVAPTVAGTSVGFAATRFGMRFVRAPR